MQRLDIFAVPKDGNQKLVSRFYKDEQIHHPQVLWFLSFRPEDVQGNLHRTLFGKNPFIQGDLVTWWLQHSQGGMKFQSFLGARLKQWMTWKLLKQYTWW